MVLVCNFALIILHVCLSYSSSIVGVRGEFDVSTDADTAGVDHSLVISVMFGFTTVLVVDFVIRFLAARDK